MMPIKFVSARNHLEKNLQLLMDRVDEMSQDIIKYNTYMRNVSKQQQQKQQVSKIKATTYCIGKV